MEKKESGIVDAGSHLQENTLLRFRVGPFRFSVPAVEVEGIVVPPRLTVIPLTPPHSKGVFLHHQRLASAISLRSKFGLPDHDESLGQLILGEVTVGLVGFWVDEVYETVDSTELEWRLMPEFIPHAAFESFAVKDGDIVMASTMQKLYDVPADQMASMLASVRQNFDLPEDIPPVEAEGLVAGNEVDDEDVFGDLVDSSQLASNTEEPGKLEKMTEDVARTGDTNHDKARTTVIDFPKTQDTDSNLKQQTSSGATVRIAVSANRDNSSASSQPERYASGSPGKATIPSGGAGTYDTARTTSSNRARDIRSRVNPYRESSAHSSRRPQAFPGGTYAGSINRVQQASSSAVHAPASSASHREEETRSGSGIAWLLLLLLLLLLGIGYWFWPTSKNDGSSVVISEKSATGKVTSNYQAPAEEAAPVTPKYEAQGTNTVNPEHTDEQSNDVANDSTSQPDGEVYRLEGQDVTVTVERNKPEAVENESKPQPGYHEFVHIVVRGDTLWDIARKYLKDPFRYPELARLSEIKNPDLIYPGDTVRIRARED